MNLSIFETMAQTKMLHAICRYRKCIGLKVEFFILEFDISS